MSLVAVFALCPLHCKSPFFAIDPIISEVACRCLIDVVEASCLQMANGSMRDRAMGLNHDV
jgi:hypothetical protein